MRPRLGVIGVLVGVLGCSTGCAPEFEFGEGTLDAGADAVLDAQTDPDGATDSGVDAGPTEDCTNGLDDDNDQLPDCADPDCDVRALCVPELPPDWLGPVAVFAGIETRPGCSASGGYPTQALDATGDLIAPDASCPVCSCDEPDGAECSAASVEYFSDSECTEACANCSSEVTETCTAQNLAPSGAIAAFMRFTAPASGGSCTAASEGNVQVTPARWDTNVRACTGASVGAGCDAGEQCLALPRRPFEERVCVYQLSEAQCPSGYDAERVVYYRGLMDTRGCSNCECGDPTCLGEVTDFAADDLCGGEGTTIEPEVCTPVDALESNERWARFNAAAPAACEPIGGTPTGSATPLLPVTVCCR